MSLSPSVACESDLLADSSILLPFFQLRRLIPTRLRPEDDEGCCCDCCWSEVLAASPEMAAPDVGLEALLDGSVGMDCVAAPVCPFPAAEALLLLAMDGMRKVAGVEDVLLASRVSRGTKVVLARPVMK